MVISTPDYADPLKVKLTWTNSLWKGMRYLPVYRKGEEAFRNSYGNGYLGISDAEEENTTPGEDSLYIPVIVPEVYTAQPNNYYSVSLSLVEDAYEFNVEWTTDDGISTGMHTEEIDGDYKVTVTQQAEEGGQATICAAETEEYSRFPCRSS